MDGVLKEFGVMSPDNYYREDALPFAKQVETKNRRKLILQKEGIL